MSNQTFDDKLLEILYDCTEEKRFAGDLYDELNNEKAIKAIKDLILSDVVGSDVEHTKWFVDVTGEYDYFHPVKKPLVERHKNELRAQQRLIINGKENSNEPV